ncbi:MAG: hypothetical protein EZS28_026562 [Streblomastix strix]|uniref:Uncharacterized protein n=1 Tax=Streblomastix strix TaxID=222440 RepID=A0A5J4V681_9EUKA|nr:MAG: hypothetical protein EZS28_026562 [Streblomastix strix]
MKTKQIGSITYYNPQVSFTTPSTTLTVTHTGRNISYTKNTFLEEPLGHKEEEPERKQPKLQQYAKLMDVVEKFHEIVKPIIEEEKKKPKIIFQDSTKNIRTKSVLLYSIRLRTFAQHHHPDPKTWTSQKNNGINLMGTYARVW